MVTCCKDCYPHCDFCIYAKKTRNDSNGKIFSISIVGCNKHSDEHHQSMAQYHGYCLDFHCKKAREGENDGT